MPPINYHVPAPIQPMAEESEEESGERRTPDISGESPSDKTWILNLSFFKFHLIIFLNHSKSS